MSDKIEIFFSFAHEDEALRKELEAHLSPLKWQGLIIDWHDRIIGAGKEWAGEIDAHLNSAHIILLLVSPDFIASGYCHDVEVQRAMERHEAGEACVIPVILRPADWEWAFGKLQALPKDGKPIISSSWHHPDEAFLDVARGIRRVVEEMRIKLFANSPRYNKQSFDIFENTVDSNRLYNTLVRLNYREQVRIFQQFKNEKRQIGSFLIHGAPSYGQSWLLNRLVNQLPNSSAVLPFKFSFERKACGRSLKDLWRELAKWVGLNNLLFPMDPHLQQEIIKRIHERWQRHSVILILSKLHEIDEQYAIKFIQDFWLPLTMIARETFSQSSKHYLLMFLIDNADCVDKWNVPIANQLDQVWEPHIPIKLEKLSPFSRDVLDDWIGYEVDTLPPKLTAQDILNNSEDGIPEFVLDHICGIFGYDWSELVKYRV